MHLDAHAGTITHGSHAARGVGWAKCYCAGAAHSKSQP
jgi:hypothetical protein